MVPYNFSSSDVPVYFVHSVFVLFEHSKFLIPVIWSCSLWNFISIFPLWTPAIQTSRRQTLDSWW